MKILFNPWPCGDIRSGALAVASFTLNSNILACASAVVYLNIVSLDWAVLVWSIYSGQIALLTLLGLLALCRDDRFAELLYAYHYAYLDSILYFGCTVYAIVYYIILDPHRLYQECVNPHRTPAKPSFIFDIRFGKKALQDPLVERCKADLDVHTTNGWWISLALLVLLLIRLYFALVLWTFARMRQTYR